MIQGQFANVRAVHQHLSLVGVIQPGDQRHQRGLSAAGGTDDAYQFAGSDGQVDVLQHCFPVFPKIAESDIAELHGAAVDRAVTADDMVIVQVSCSIQHLADAAVGGGGPGALQDDGRQKIQRHEHLGQIGDEGGKRAHFHTAYHDLLSRQPNHRQRGDVDGQRRHGHHQLHHFQRGDAFFHKLVIDGAEFLDLMILPHEGFDDPLVRDGLADIDVQQVQLLLHPGVPGRGHQNDGGNGRGQHRHHNDEHLCQVPVQGKGHGQRADEHHRAAEHPPQQRLDKVLDLGNVICDAGDEGTRGEMVNVGEGKGLDLFKNIPSHLRRQPAGAPDGKIGPQNAGAHHNARQNQHQQAVSQDIADIAVGCADIDDICVDVRQYELSAGLDHHKQRAQQKAVPVFFNIRCISFQSLCSFLCCPVYFILTLLVCQLLKSFFC